MATQNYSGLVWGMVMRVDGGPHVLPGKLDPVDRAERESRTRRVRCRRAAR
jgi:hypothetical protein